jgi:hypothetical protein
LHYLVFDLYSFVKIEKARGLMTISPEQVGGKSIIPWRGPMEDPSLRADKASTKPFVLNLPGIKKDLPPATEKDDDATVTWGDWSGKTNYEEQAQPSEQSTLDEDELRAATGCGQTLLGS